MRIGVAVIIYHITYDDGEKVYYRRPAITLHMLQRGLSTHSPRTHAHSKPRTHTPLSPHGQHARAAPRWPRTYGGSRHG